MEFALQGHLLLDHGPWRGAVWKQDYGRVRKAVHQTK
jgi:hypothetical protein